MSSSLENIYCRGPLLHAVQTIASSSSDDSKNTRGLFEDCKTFVDMALKFDAEVVLAEFRVLAEAPGGLKASKLKEFVEANFSAPGDDLEEYVLPELSRFSAVGSPMSAEVPEAALGLTAGVSDPALATWAQALCKLWPLLCRRVSAAGIEHSERRSLLPRTRPMMVPGGRFREVYYWDTYFVVRGLLASGLKDTARAVVENLLHDVDKFEFVPNGSRIYYLNRSQPPLLSAMVQAVFDSTGDVAWLASALPLLEREYSYWMTSPKAIAVYVSSTGDNPTVLGPFVLNRYFVQAHGPRPESYREDLATAQSPEACAWVRASAKEVNGGTVIDEAAAAQAVYGELATAAESGWDFSSRWMTRTPKLSTNGLSEGSAPEDPSSALRFPLGSSRPTQCVPVDLNCILLKVEEILARAHTIIADAAVASIVDADATAGSKQAYDVESSRTAASRFEAHALARRQAIEAVLWDNTAGRWRDAWLEAYRGDRGCTKAAEGTLSAEEPIATTLQSFCTVSTVADVSPEDALPAATQAAVNRGVAVPLTTLPFLSDFVPLWAGLADDSGSRQERVLVALRRSSLLGAAGVHTSSPAASASNFSIDFSGQQWDAPNCWPPLLLLLVEGLERCAATTVPPIEAEGGSSSTMKAGDGPALAREIAQTWVRSAHAAFVNTGFMYEKYHSDEIGVGGSGGEYAPQVGFGWSNGVALCLLQKYGSFLRAAETGE